MTHALIVDGEVVQLDLTGNPPEGYIGVPDFVQPGYRLVGGKFQLPKIAQTVIVPETISDRQFFAVLEKMGRITYEEALQAVKTGDLPPAFEAFLASLDEDKQKSYRLFMEGETFFSRNHQITLDLAAFFKMTDPQVDAIFIEGDKL